MLSEVERMGVTMKDHGLPAGLRRPNRNALAMQDNK